MFYFIKNLKWTELKGVDIWYANNFEGRVSLRYAGVYTDEDKQTVWCKYSIEIGTIEFVPITKDIIRIIEKQILSQAHHEIESFKKLLRK